LMLVPVLARRLPTAPHTSSSAGNPWFSGLEHPGRFWLLAGASFGIAAFSALAVSFSFERLVNDLGWSGTQAAAVSLAGGTLGGIGFFTGGRMADGWGRRPTAMVGVICGLVGGVALFWVTSIPWIISAIFVSAFGSFTLVPALGTLRNELFAESIRSRAVTWVNNVAVIGSVTGLSIGAVAIERYGLARTITGLGTMSLVAIVFLALLPETLQIGQTVRVTDPRQA
ncbi:MAG: MFS transporter, partial [Acidimicrobiia bacterium]|nr:MFS transporter [Acidimicrobiia bacterium]